MKVRYLVDTGAEISVLPEISKGRLYKSVFNLQAENGKPVAIYGKNYVYFNVGLRKSIHCILVAADVSMSAMGMELLQHHMLLIDTRKWSLVNGNTYSSVCVSSSSGYSRSQIGHRPYDLRRFSRLTLRLLPPIEHRPPTNILPSTLS